ncbi:uncharacterized protein LOC143666122 [Tamandua tetradactyla]|uniref:uncharacterized protein LOC143666122 n=1 Tax=Tamandua tetradactyla TaxID=48850 RepID=UPI0040540728
MIQIQFSKAQYDRTCRSPRKCRIALWSGWHRRDLHNVLKETHSFSSDQMRVSAKQSQRNGASCSDTQQAGTSSPEILLEDFGKWKEILVTGQCVGSNDIG